MTRKIYTGDYDIGEPSLSPPKEWDHDQDEYEQALHDHLCDCEEFDGFDSKTGCQEVNMMHAEESLNEWNGSIDYDYFSIEQEY